MSADGNPIRYCYLCGGEYYGSYSDHMEADPETHLEDVNMPYESSEEASSTVDMDSLLEIFSDDVLDDDSDEMSFKGLSKEEILSIPTVELQDADASTICTICLENFVPKESGKVLPCKHKFHTECISRWLAEDNSCPTCRGPGISRPEYSQDRDDDDMMFVVGEFIPPVL